MTGTNLIKTKLIKELILYIYKMMTTFPLDKYNQTGNEATVEEEIDDHEKDKVDDDGAKIDEGEYDDE